MIIYPDTSFLISYLHEDDKNYTIARSNLSADPTQKLVLCEVHLLEFPAAVRAAVHRGDQSLPEHIARRVLARFDRLVERGFFVRKEIKLSESILMVRSMGELYGWAKRHTAFDLWHIAAAWGLNSQLFLTFDNRQAEIAAKLGLRT